MLNKKISRDREVAELINELGGDAGILFTWMIAHLDREGRVDADPEVLKGLVVPKISRIDVGMVPEVIRKASGLGLIEVYEDTRGNRFIVYPKFEQNQTGLRKKREPASNFPDPEECRKVSGIDPEECRMPSGCDPAEGKGREHNIREEKGREENTLDPGKASSRSLRARDQVSSHTVDDIWAHYRRWHPRAARKIGAKNDKLCRARLTEGFAPDDLKQAIDGYHRSPFHQGVNDRNQKYLGLELILRDQDHTQKGIEMAADPTIEHIMTEKTRKGIAGAQQWLQQREEKRRREGEG